MTSLSSSISNPMVLTQILRYVSVSSLTFIILDILTNIDDEVELYFERKHGIGTIAYTFSR
ncbi:hypothetical protein K435DRAFT_861384 [Dendrothele bispora CBS 962.96]|uniref:DUF6533 domain-containing protein n=1 Tax=Dendrothele bispora (strain CBS 962.96) TaxID=1314807 RepID=A0A4S8LVF2_DENBC|nr:hypothetical protein K435DRAFT_861384 [Dendrothele bispora CBS 962.96]